MSTCQKVFFCFFVFVFFYLAQSQTDTIKVFKWALHCYVLMVESIPPPADPLCPVESLPCMSSQTLELDGLVSPSLLSAAHLASIGCSSCFGDKPRPPPHATAAESGSRSSGQNWRLESGGRGNVTIKTTPSPPPPCVFTLQDVKSCLCKSLQD